MAGPDDTLTFELDSGRLDAALAALQGRQGEQMYPVAWQALTTEAGRRRAGAAPAAVRMRRTAFDELPKLVRSILDVRLSAADCPHCGRSNPIPTQFLEIESDVPLAMACRGCEREFQVR